MESQLQRPVGHSYDAPQAQAVHSVAEDEGEHHHEKKSVLKKVKAKAKKIKDTLKKQGHGHEHEHDHEHGREHDSPHERSETEEDEDEEMIQDPEVHGAPIYESAAVRSAIPNQNINLEKPTAVGEDRYGSKSSEQGVARPGEQGQQHFEESGTHLGMPTSIGKDRYGAGSNDQGLSRPDMQWQQQHFGQSGTNLGTRTTTEGVHAPEDKDVSFSPGIHGTGALHPGRTDENVEKMHGEGGGIGILGVLEEDPNNPRAINTSNYESKVTDPTGEGGEAEISPLIRSLDKMSVSDESAPKPELEPEQKSYTGSHDQFSPQPYPTADEFASKPSTISSDRGVDESTPKSYNLSKPEELPQDTLTGKSAEQSGYIEKLSTAISVIADKAISAKKDVASKLGYGGTEGTRGQEMGEGTESGKSASATEYAHKVAATVTEKLAPVYEKVADAGSSVISKVKGSTNASKDETPEIINEGTKGQETGESNEAEKSASTTEYAHKVAATVTGKLAPVYGKVADAGSSVISKVKGSTTGGKDGGPEMRNEDEDKVSDKGVSTKEYLAEKFKPSDEDKALSEVISETLHMKKKEERAKTREERKPMGKVTESEEVSRRLGSGTENQREGEDAIAAGSESSGKGVVDKIKDAVTSWVGKGSQEQNPEGTPGLSGRDETSAATQERRLQESVD